MKGPYRIVTPHWRVKSVGDIRFGVLKKLGIRALLLDLDNTLLGFATGGITDEVKSWLTAAQAAGFKLCLVSNARARRLRLHSEALGIPMVAAAQKPRRRALRRAMQMLGTTPLQTAMIGDQVFTDILVGNRLGMCTILVTPLASGDGWLWMPWIRRVERWLVAHTPDRLKPADLDEVPQEPDTPVSAA